MGYYQEVDEARFYDSWEGDKEADYDLHHRDPSWIQPPDSHYIAKHVPAKVAIMRGIAEIRQRRIDEEQARALGGHLSRDGQTILVPVMTPGEKIQARDRYALNKAAKVGSSMECGACGKKITKTHYQQAFCPPTKSHGVKTYQCKDLYHNATNAQRAARANVWGTK